MQQDLCTPGDCCYTTTMDLTNADFDPQVEDVVKFYNDFAGYGGTTYTATVISIDEGVDGKIYRVEYMDETTHLVTRSVTIETLSPITSFDPQVADVVRYFNQYQGDGGTTYTATIMLIEEIDGVMKYNVEYVDESPLGVFLSTS